jgi:hypothetical protein
MQKSDAAAEAKAEANAPIPYKELILTGRAEAVVTDFATFLTDLAKYRHHPLGFAYLNRINFRLDKAEFDLVFRCYDGTEPASMFQSIQHVLEVLQNGFDLHVMTRTLTFADDDCRDWTPEPVRVRHLLSRLQEKFDAAKTEFLSSDDGAYDDASFMRARASAV